MRRRRHSQPARVRGRSWLRRSLVIGALWLVPLSLLGCSSTNSNWTDLINPWARATPTPEATPVPETHASAPESAAPATSLQRKRGRAAGQSPPATQKSGIPAPAPSVQPGVPQLEDTEATGGNYQISAAEPGGASTTAIPAGSPSANASETITLGERPDSSPTLGSPSASATGNYSSLTPHATPTSTATPVNESIQAKAERMIRTVKATATQIDQTSLSANEASRFKLASRLIRNSEKTMTEHDYAAAASLARKATDLLAPLPRKSESTPAHR